MSRQETLGLAGRAATRSRASGDAEQGERRMCDVDVCPAVAVDGSGFCAVHAGAKKLAHVMVGQKCSACKRALRAGDWVTRASTLETMVHAVCPPRRPRGDGSLEGDLFAE